MNYSDFIYDFNLYLCERFGYRNCCSVMHNANGIRRLRSLNANDTDVDIRPEDNFECLGTIIGRIYGTYELISCKEDKEKTPWI